MIARRPKGGERSQGAHDRRRGSKRSHAQLFGSAVATACRSAILLLVLAVAIIPATSTLAQNTGEFTAGAITADTSQQVFAVSGPVVAEFGQQSLQAGRVVFNRVNGRVLARGGVTLRTSSGTTQSEVMEITGPMRDFVATAIMSRGVTSQQLAMQTGPATALPAGAPQMPIGGGALVSGGGYVVVPVQGQTGQVFTGQTIVPSQVGVVSGAPGVSTVGTAPPIAQAVPSQLTTQVAIPQSAVIASQARPVQVQPVTTQVVVPQTAIAVPQQRLVAPVGTRVQTAPLQQVATVPVPQAVGTAAVPQLTALQIPQRPTAPISQLLDEPSVPGPGGPSQPRVTIPPRRTTPAGTPPTARSVTVNPNEPVRPVPFPEVGTPAFQLSGRQVAATGPVPAATPGAPSLQPTSRLTDAVPAAPTGPSIPAPRVNAPTGRTVQTPTIPAPLTGATRPEAISRGAVPQPAVPLPLDLAALERGSEPIPSGAATVRSGGVSPRLLDEPAGDWLSSRPSTAAAPRSVPTNVPLPQRRVVPDTAVPAAAPFPAEPTGPSLLELPASVIARSGPSDAPVQASRLVGPSAFPAAPTTPPASVPLPAASQPAIDFRPPSAQPADTIGDLLSPRAEPADPSVRFSPPVRQLDLSAPASDAPPPPVFTPPPPGLPATFAGQLAPAGTPPSAVTTSPPSVQPTFRPTVPPASVGSGVTGSNNGLLPRPQFLSGPTGASSTGVPRVIAPATQPARVTSTTSPTLSAPSPRVPVPPTVSAPTIAPAVGATGRAAPTAQPVIETPPTRTLPAISTIPSPSPRSIGPAPALPDGQGLGAAVIPQPLPAPITVPEAAPAPAPIFTSPALAPPTADDFLPPGATAPSARVQVGPLLPPGLDDAGAGTLVLPRPGASEVPGGPAASTGPVVPAVPEATFIPPPPPAILGTSVSGPTQRLGDEIPAPTGPQDVSRFLPPGSVPRGEVATAPVGIEHQASFRWDRGIETTRQIAAGMVPIGNDQPNQVAQAFLPPSSSLTSPAFDEDLPLISSSTSDTPSQVLRPALRTPMPPPAQRPLPSSPGTPSSEAIVQPSVATGPAAPVPQTPVVLPEIGNPVETGLPQIAAVVPATPPSFPVPQRRPSVLMVPVRAAPTVTAVPASPPQPSTPVVSAPSSNVDPGSGLRLPANFSTFGLGEGEAAPLLPTPGALAPLAIAPWTEAPLLASGIQSAVARAPQGTVFVREAAAAQHDTAAARRERWNPELEGFGSAGVRAGRLEDDGTVRRSGAVTTPVFGGVRAQLPLYDSGRREAQAQVASVGIDRARLSQTESAAETAAAVRTAYIEHGAATAHAASLRVLEERFRAVLADAERQFTAQQLTSDAMEQARAFMVTLATRISALDQARADANLAWRAQTGLGALEAVQAWPVLPSAFQSGALQAAIEDSPRLGLARAELERRGHEREFTEAVSGPQLGLAGRAAAGLEGEGNVFVGLVASVPLFDNGVNDARVAAADERIGAAEASIIAERDALSERVTARNNSLRRIGDRDLALTQELNAAREQFNQSMRRARAQIGEVRSITVAAGEVMRALQQRYDATLTSAEAHIDVIRLLGRTSPPR